LEQTHSGSEIARLWRVTTRRGEEAPIAREASSIARRGEHNPES